MLGTKTSMYLSKKPLSPLSEYVGSHIFQLLGYTAHNTMLGYFFNKELGKKQIVVACEDFTENDKYTLVKLCETFCSVNA